MEPMLDLERLVALALPWLIGGLVLWVRARMALRAPTSSPRVETERVDDGSHHCQHITH
jgi:hypothetical protein